MDPEMAAAMKIAEAADAAEAAEAKAKEKEKASAAASRATKTKRQRCHGRERTKRRAFSSEEGEMYGDLPRARTGHENTVRATHRH